MDPILLVYIPYKYGLDSLSAKQYICNFALWNICTFKFHY